MIPEQIADLFDRRGDSEYGGEAVTQLEHALQCAQLAEQAGASDALVVAALLHDIGHLLHDLPDDAPDEGIDDRHEASGYHFLREHFEEAVSAPVRMHVAAKRYLCTVEAEYLAQLSPPSLLSFELQGGMMDPAELDEFRNSPHWEAAVQLRRWDDAAKSPGAATPSVAHYLPRVRAEVQRHEAVAE
ncbi:MAG: phosphonate degradation HD-domain oxygenase [Planctomycetota bacterium]